MKDGLQRLIKTIRQLGILLIIAFVVASVWTGFDFWQSAQTQENNQRIIAESEIPDALVAYIENVLVGQANRDNYEIISVSLATSPRAVAETAEEAWCINGRFTPADRDPRRVLAYRTGNNWAVRGSTPIVWQGAGCVQNTPPTATP